EVLINPTNINSFTIKLLFVQINNLTGFKGNSFLRLKKLLIPLHYCTRKARCDHLHFSDYINKLNLHNSLFRITNLIYLFSSHLTSSYIELLVLWHERRRSIFNKSTVKSESAAT
ncbi:hypothetical protein C0J52_14113, partial [Blattella germanica]